MFSMFYWYGDGQHQPEYLDKFCVLKIHIYTECYEINNWRDACLFKILHYISRSSYSLPTVYSPFYKLKKVMVTISQIFFPFSARVTFPDHQTFFKFSSIPCLKYYAFSPILLFTIFFTFSFSLFSLYFVNKNNYVSLLNKKFCSSTLL